jgi:hypothetical protein
MPPQNAEPPDAAGSAPTGRDGVRAGSVSDGSGRRSVAYAAGSAPYFARSASPIGQTGLESRRRLAAAYAFPRPSPVATMLMAGPDGRGFHPAVRECVAPCAHPMCNACFAKMTQSLIRTQLNSLHSETALCNPFFRGESRRTDNLRPPPHAGPN